MRCFSRRRFLSYSGLASVGLISLTWAKETRHEDPKRKFKKGVGLVTKPSSSWFFNLESLRVDWHYSWGLKKPKDYPPNISFVPMVWGPWGLEEAVKYINEHKEEDDVDCLLGFNEPDEQGQSNIPVERALELWPTLMEAKVRLGSPACVHPDNEWMKKFMHEVDRRQLRVDFVTIHDYGGPSPEALIQKCRKIHEMYSRPVWITEFAVGDWQAKDVKEHRHSPQRVLEFMQAVLPELDRLDCVERYAWFPASKDSSHLGTSALFEDDGTLTPLGRYYADYESQTPV